MAESVKEGVAEERKNTRNGTQAEEKRKYTKQKSRQTDLLLLLDV